MKLLLGGVVAALLLLLFPNPARAQICAGAPSFLDGPTQVGVAGVFAQDRQGVGAAIGAGRTGFGSFGVGLTHFQNVDSNSKNIAAIGGADLPVGADRRVFICPIGRAGFSFGPNFGATKTRTSQFGGGGSLGIVAVDGIAVMVVPTIGVNGIYERATADRGASSVTVSDTYGVVGIGIGVIFNRRIGLLPEVSVPFAIPNPEFAFSLSFSVNY